MTNSEYETRLAAQGRACAICGNIATGKRKNGILHVDHDHATGRVRDLLCNQCNVAIGALREEPALCLAAAAYLQRWKLTPAA